MPEAVYYVVCQARTDGGPAVAPCTADAGLAGYPVVKQGVLVDQNLAGLLIESAKPFDYALASQYFAFSFTLVVVPFLLGLCVRWIFEVLDS